MRQVKINILNYHDDFEKLVNRKDPGKERERLVKLLPELKKRFEDYEINKGKLEQITIVKRSKPQKVALAGCYSSGTKFKADLEKVFLWGLQLPREEFLRVPCPYCFLGFVETWDHFLPSSKFPDFYAFPPNLIHVCSVCNTKKGNRWVHPDRQTIHPYFDPVDEINFINCEIRTNPLRANFCTVTPLVVSEEMVYFLDIAAKHFSNFRLRNMLRAESGRKIAEFLDLAKFFRNQGILTNNILVRNIEDKIKILSAKESVNHWELVMWKALRNIPNLITQV